MPSKRRKIVAREATQPRNRYTEKSPDFAHLASLYPSFSQYVFYSIEGRARIDWTYYNATRELTRVLLLHDHGINWWIPDGQLCPTVPNRSNYIHWIENLLSSDIVIWNSTSYGSVRGFDIGTGANCIYPLLGASLFGWSFVGSDVTDVALEWAERNVRNNPHISDLVEIRRVRRVGRTDSVVYDNDDSSIDRENEVNIDTSRNNIEPLSVMISLPVKNSSGGKIYSGLPILLDAVKEGEKFDFCMCNPPFFESIEEAGLNPKTSCGGTIEEMVFPGGEQAFISQIIDDSSVLRQTFRWYTSMVGKKANLKALVRRAHEVGATVVKTTDFVQGRTFRWGLAWSFFPISKCRISPHLVEKQALTFILEGVERQSSAWHVLQSIESLFVSSGASVRSDSTAFTIKIVALTDHCDRILKHYGVDEDEENLSMFESTHGDDAEAELHFQISIFQQIPGTLLVKGSLRYRDNLLPGLFLSVFQRLEEVLKDRFCRQTRIHCTTL